MVMKKLPNVAQPIAKRKLVMGDREVHVVIGKPQRSENGSDLYCPYLIEVEHKERKRESCAYGLDAVQALQLALKKIGIDLAYLARSENIPISWLPDDEGKTGFPT